MSPVRSFTLYGGTLAAMYRVYVDEAGDRGMQPTSSAYFVVAAILVKSEWKFSAINRLVAEGYASDDGHHITFLRLFTEESSSLAPEPSSSLGSPGSLDGSSAGSHPSSSLGSPPLKGGTETEGTAEAEQRSLDTVGGADADIPF